MAAHSDSDDDETFATLGRPLEIIDEGSLVCLLNS